MNRILLILLFVFCFSTNLYALEGTWTGTDSHSCFSELLKNSDPYFEIKDKNNIEIKIKSNNSFKITLKGKNYNLPFFEGSIKDNEFWVVTGSAFSTQGYYVPKNFESQLFGKLNFKNEIELEFPCARTYDITLISSDKNVCNKERQNVFLNDKSREFYDQKKYEEAFKCTLVAANKGDPFAIGDTGWLYQNGVGIKKNYEVANQWFEKGVILNDLYSKINLSKNLKEGLGTPKNEKRSFQLIFEAAQTGDTYAEAEVAIHYLKGIGVDPDYDEAFKNFKNSANKGNFFAQGYLGWMYAGGRGTDLNYEEGYEWTLKSANSGEPFAQANLGWHYLNGFGVTKNMEKAIKWFELASAQGNQYAKDNLKAIGSGDAAKAKIQKEFDIDTDKLKELEKARIEEERIKRLQKKIDQETSPIEEEYLALKNTNVRSEPNINSKKLGMINKDTSIYVRGKYKDWYIVEKDGEKYGYVFAKLLSPSPTTIPTPAIPAEGGSGINYGNYHALVIGNNKYDHWTRLDTAVNDAEVIASILENKFNFQVTPLIDKGYEEIKDAIYDVSHEMGENDNLLIYYAGHGSIKEDERKRGYWIPRDGDVEKTTKWISNNYIVDNLFASKAKHVIVIADSCYSATLRGQEEISSTKELKKLASKKTRIIMTSGGVEPVEDSGKDNHSIFAYALIKKLQEIDRVTVAGYIFPDIRQYVVNNVDEQFPELSILKNTGHDGGDFIFVPN